MALAHRAASGEDCDVGKDNGPLAPSVRTLHPSFPVFTIHQHTLSQLKVSADNV